MHILLTAAGDNGRRFGHNCCRQTSPNLIKQEASINKLISTLIYGRNEHSKATHPSGGMDSSNPRRWRGERLQHHGDVVCHVVCAFCVVSDS
jgi:hypothetical protein